MNEAALLAARGDKTAVGAADFENAIERLVAGLERKRVMTVKGAKRSRTTKPATPSSPTILDSPDPVHKISIVGRGFRRTRLHAAPAE